MLWATLRGLVMAQMLTPIPIDSSRERALLVDLIAGLLDGVCGLTGERLDPRRRRGYAADPCDGSGIDAAVHRVRHTV